MTKYRYMSDNPFYTNRVYLVDQWAKLKSDGKWVDCIVYHQEDDIKMYVRTVEDFQKAFKII